MSTDTPTNKLAERYRRLAALVEQLEADGYNVADAEPSDDQHGRQQADVTLHLDGGLEMDPFRPGAQEEDSPPTSEAPDEYLDDEPDQSTGGSTASGPIDVELGLEAAADSTEDEPEEDQETDTADEAAEGTVAAEVLEALHDEGETTPSDLELVTGVSGIYRALNQLEDGGLIETRPDPDDGRRTLYRPAGSEAEEPVDEDDEVEEPVEVWCGICGEGPYDRLSTHASHRHDGDVVPLDHEPGEEELIGDVGDGSEDDTDEQSEELPELDGLAIPEHVTFDAVHGAVEDCDTAWGVANAIQWGHTPTRQLLTEMELLNELPSPNGRPDKVSVARDGGDYTEPGPHEIVDQSDVPARLDLPNLLEAAEVCDTLREAAEELGVGDVGLLTDAYWRLDLKEQGRPRFVDERVETVREVVADVD